ncbi:MAG: low molecular weight phosphotyrosine protein phosphatase [Cellvibrionaceae bacterium]|nr:low molecular weight phosphotyrosine protein phosphatase [Cellvibrionaceae bacterium]
MTKPAKVSVLFVCLGNICRSPSADGIMRRQVADAGLAGLVAVDSAGTGQWHVGKGPDARATAHAAQRGYDLSPLRARQFKAADFDRFDYIIPMDRQNLADIEAQQVRPYGGQLALMLDYLPAGYPKPGVEVPVEVPDPYYGGEDGFEQVLDLLEAATTGLLADICQRHGLTQPSGA